MKSQFHAILCIERHRFVMEVEIYNRLADEMEVMHQEDDVQLEFVSANWWMHGPLKTKTFLVDHIHHVFFVVVINQDKFIESICVATV